ncbi:MAG: amino acid permease [Flammeovirgaceae bacterium]|nr:amino acid permease [Flammeovirgaceae bacterium]
MDKIKNEKLNLIQSISLVIGNMIGVGIFMLPASLSEYGSISIFGWILSGFMALIIANIFRNISINFKGKSNPIDYLETIFGDFVGFFVIWGYWISILLVNASIAIAITSYSSVFLDIDDKSEFAIPMSIFIVILIAIINYNGIKNTGNFQLITTLLKIIPLFTTIILGFYFFDLNNFFPINLSLETNFKAITITTTLTFFAFLGIESSSIPSDRISNPNKNIPRSTMIGTIITVFIYIFTMIAMIGIMHPNEIHLSSAPFADATGVILGENGKKIIAIFAIISGLGCLNGWTLLQIEIPKNLSNKGLLGKRFSKLNSNGVPYQTLIFSTIIVSILISINYTKSLTNIFTFLILTSTFCSLMLYLFISISEIIMNFKNNSYNKVSIQLLRGVLSLFFVLWLIIGVGTESIISGIVLLSFCIPIYIYQKKYA